jgi:serine-type D-Ala-D-Ala carboxypeptidase/endopeptidase (penicillin-binding protein 4)
MALVVLALPRSGAAEPTVAGTATLTALPQRVTYGRWVRFTGGVDAPAPCEAGREVRLRAVEPGGAWRRLKVRTTDDAGAFSFFIKPEHSARYDVWLPSVGSCERVVSSPAIPVPVAARVTLTGPSDGIAAGSCGSLSATVEPAVPGTPVRFQRLAGSSWTTVATATLGSTSSASIQRCETWQDLGTEQWRAWWSANDAGSTANADGVSPTLRLGIVEAWWMVKIDRLIGARRVGVAVGSIGHVLYEHDASAAHIPASNEKLLLSMALLSRLPRTATIVTRAEAAAVGDGGVIPGDLWLVGRGDPTIGRHRMGQLAAGLIDAGITRIRGSVRGSTDYFAHDWSAPGWRPEFQEEEIALPTALAYQGNTFDGRHVSDPERRAAAALTKMLRARGVKVAGKPGAGRVPSGLHGVAQVVSPSLQRILRAQNLDSVNFDAEMLGKLLGVLASGTPGTIDKGADAIHAWTSAMGVSTVNEDSSGLSYANRATALGIESLLRVAETSPWGAALRATLPEPGEGTLEHRLAGIPVVAKTGTLENVSALSGWVRLARTGQQAEFSILSGGFDTSRAKDIEDAIVTTVSRNGH